MAWGRASASIARRAAPARPVENIEEVAPGAPGAAGYWSPAAKTGIGTSYAPYGAGRAASRVWFSVAGGVLTETMYGLIHQAQVRQLQIAIQGPDLLVFEEDGELESRTEYLALDALERPLALAYRIVNTDREGRFEIEKHLFTDPARDCLFVRVIVRAHAASVTPHVLVDPHLSATSGDDFAEASEGALHAWDDRAHLVVAAAEPFKEVSAGFMGVSDGATALRRAGGLPRHRTTGASAGNVGLAATLDPVPAGQERTFDLVLGFDETAAGAYAKARASLASGYEKIREAFVGGGGRVGWSDYLESLKELPRLAEMSGDGGRLLYASALVLKAQEDKTHSGALIASLSTPWGETVPAEVEATGYKAVWPRDFYQVASALLAMGDRETPAAALDYLRAVQVRGSEAAGFAGGWFLQKTHVDGTPEWTGVQLDQTAMPIMLADKLYRAGLVSEDKLRDLFDTSLAAAADFLIRGGRVALQRSPQTIAPPRTQMERWEEQGGYSPSTTAAVVAGLLAAADMARILGRNSEARRCLVAARRVASEVVRTTFTRTGLYGDGRYFLRIAPSGRPDAAEPLEPRNGKPGLAQQHYLDAGFLELARYGIMAAGAPEITASLEKIDAQDLPDRMRVRYDFAFPGAAGSYPGWRRYSDDGYGEDEDTGAAFGPVGPSGLDTPGQRGRVWPIFTGERGHYEIALALEKAGRLPPAARARVRETFVRGMELFANAGLMLPEQVHDGVGAGAARKGAGTGAATPLAWSHAEYVKLLRSLSDGAVWDRLHPEVLRGLV